MTQHRGRPIVIRHPTQVQQNSDGLPGLNLDKSQPGQWNFGMSQGTAFGHEIIQFVQRPIDRTVSQTFSAAARVEV